MQLIFWIIGILLSAGAGYWVYRRDVQRSTSFPWLTALLRSLVILATLALLLAPPITITKNYTEKPIIVLLQDNSSSIGPALGSDSATYRKDVTTLINKLSEQYKVVAWGFGSSVKTDSLFNYAQPATDIAAALSAAQEYYGVQNLGAVILATDGRFNQGLNPLYQQLALKCPLYTVGIGDSQMKKDLRILKAYANKSVVLNSNFEVRADIAADLCKGYNNAVQLKEGDKTIATLPLAINSDKFDRTITFTVKADQPGLHHYVLSLPPTDSELLTANNKKDIFVEVADERKNILLLSDAPHPDINAIRDALSDLQTYSVTVCTADRMPASLAPYRVIVLHDLPSMKNNITGQLRMAGKPLWFIFSGHSDMMMYNALRDFTHNNFSPTLGHDMPVVYNTAFSAFTLPQQIQSVTDKMPPMVGNAGNVSFNQSGFVLFHNKGVSAAPVWFLQQGATPYAVLLGEGLWHWRMYEYKNFGNQNITDECIRQTIAFLAAGNNEKPFSVVLPKYEWSDQEAINLNAYLQNANRELINTPDAKITIMDSAEHKTEFSFERNGSAYGLNIGIWAPGTYHYTAQTTAPDQSKTYTVTGTFVVTGMPLEMMQQGADYPLLYSLAHEYKGAFFAANHISSLYDTITHNDHIKPLIQTNTETAPLVDKKWYFIVILLLATAEWLLRKYWLAQ